MMKKLFALLLALAMLLSVTAVFAEDAAEDASVPDTLLATVNGEEIRENDATLQYYYTSALSSLGTDDAEAQHVARMYAMSYAIQILLVKQKAAGYYTEEDYEAFRAEAKADWDEIIEEFMAEEGISDESSEEDRIAARGDVLSFLESNYGYDEERYVSEAVDDLILYGYLDKIAEDLKAENPALAATEEEIQDTYNSYVTEEMESIGNEVSLYEMYQMYYGYEFHYIPEGYRGITHILLDVDQELLDAWTDLTARLEESSEATEPTDGDPEAATEPEEPVTAEMVEEARLAIIASQQEKIDEINARLAGGESFEDLMAEYGTDPGMLDDYYRLNGYSVHKDSISFVQQFTDAAAALENVGDVSEPIVTPYGIHILHYLRDIPAGPIEMTDEVRDELRSEIEDDRVNDAVTQVIEQWQAEAEIVWTEEGKDWEYDEDLMNKYLYGETDESVDEDVDGE